MGSYGSEFWRIRLRETKATCGKHGGWRVAGGWARLVDDGCTRQSPLVAGRGVAIVPPRFAGPARNRGRFHWARSFFSGDDAHDVESARRRLELGARAGPLGMAAGAALRARPGAGLQR